MNSLTRVVVDLRHQGWTYARIGAALDISASSAWRMARAGGVARPVWPPVVVRVTSGGRAFVVQERG